MVLVLRLNSFATSSAEIPVVTERSKDEVFAVIESKRIDGQTNNDNNRPPIRLLSPQNEGNIAVEKGVEGGDGGRHYGVSLWSTPRAEVLQTEK